MVKKIRNLFIFSLISILFASLFFVSVNKIFSVANHVVISEIQISGIIANDEFVELYNPTDTAVDLEDWRLSRKTSSGTQSNLASSITGIIPAYGYFLIAHPAYDGLVQEDFLYTATSSGIASNNTVVLYSDSGVTVVDKVGMGTATDVENVSIDYPSTGKSIERKALSTSTVSSMVSGGEDEFQGNGEDTNNNSADFILRETPEPQNSSSIPEIPTMPSPSPYPSISPTPEPTPTQEPTPIPTIEPTPIPSIIPQPTPAPTRQLRKLYWRTHLSRLFCYLNYREIKFDFFTFHFPYVVCRYH